jgi:hypothetical protein
MGAAIFGPDLGFGGSGRSGHAEIEKQKQAKIERREFRPVEARACVPSSSKSSSFLTTSGCAMAATAVERRARGVNGEAGRRAAECGGARAPAASRDLAEE